MKQTKKAHVAVMVEAVEGSARNREADLVQALREFVAFTVDSYRDGMAEGSESPEQFLAMAMETWQGLREDS